MNNDFVNGDLNVISALCNTLDKARLAHIHAECVLTYIDRLIKSTYNCGGKTLNPTLCKVRDDLTNIISLTKAIDEKLEETIDYVDC